MRASTDRVDLLFAIKPLARAKTRLRGVSGEHESLVLAIASDTVATAARSPLVRRVLVVTSDRRVRRAVGELGAAVTADPPGERAHGPADGWRDGLNTALRHGAALLRAEDPGSIIGALQADLPALREHELRAGITAAGGARAYCADRHGTGTALLLSAAGAPLEPRFGVGSAAAHERTGATALQGGLPGLRTDVDTAADLAVCARLGTGPRTAAALSDPPRPGGMPPVDSTGSGHRRECGT